MTIVIGLTALAIGYLIVVPLVAMVIVSLRGPQLPFGGPTAQWGLEAYQLLFGGAGGNILDVARTTVVYVGGAATVSTILAFALAWLVVRTDLPLRTFVSVMILVPYIIPPIVRAQSWVLMLAPESGLLNQTLRALPFVTATSGPIDPFAFSTVVVVQGVVAVTFPFLLLMPIIQNMDGSLEEASRTSGAGAWSTFRRITLPVLMPGALGIVLLSTILLMGSLEIPLLFGQQEGSNIFALRLWTLLIGNASELPRYGLAAAYGVVFLTGTLLLFRVYLRLTRDASRRASITGKGYRPNRLPLGRWRWPVFAIVIAYLVPTSVLPGIALAWSAVTPYAMPITLDNLAAHTSLDAFGAVIRDGEFYASFLRTGVIAGASATVAVLLATVAAWVVARSRGTWGAGILDTLASSSIAIPTVIVGFSAFLFYLVINRWVPLIGTLLILVLAYSYRMSVSYRVSHSAVLQVSTELEEAASTSGASRLATFRRVIVPLLLPTSAAVWIQLFILGAHEFTLPAFLATPETRPLSWYLFARINPGAAQLYAPNQGAAMALLFTAAVFIGAYVLRWLVAQRSIASRTTGTARGAMPAPAGIAGQSGGPAGRGSG
jgi:iron(III) transport system permease protein